MAVRIQVSRYKQIELGGEERDARSTGWHRIAEEASPHEGNASESVVLLGALSQRGYSFSAKLVGRTIPKLLQWTDSCADFIVCGAWQSVKVVVPIAQSLVYLLAHLPTSVDSASPSAFDVVCDTRGRASSWALPSSLAPSLPRPPQDVGLLPVLMTFTLLLSAFGGASKIQAR